MNKTNFNADSTYIGELFIEFIHQPNKTRELRSPHTRVLLLRGSVLLELHLNTLWLRFRATNTRARYKQPTTTHRPVCLCELCVRMLQLWAHRIQFGGQRGHTLRTPDHESKQRQHKLSDNTAGCRYDKQTIMENKPRCSCCLNWLLLQWMQLHSQTNGR